VATILRVLFLWVFCIWCMWTSIQSSFQNHSRKCCWTSHQQSEKTECEVRHDLVWHWTMWWYSSISFFFWICQTFRFILTCTYQVVGMMPLPTLHLFIERLIRLFKWVFCCCHLHFLFFTIS
jgi:hypothetical protein